MYQEANAAWCIGLLMATLAGIDLSINMHGQAILN
jgi:hypothetical protein